MQKALGRGYSAANRMPCLFSPHLSLCFCSFPLAAPVDSPERGFPKIYVQGFLPTPSSHFHPPSLAHARTGTHQHTHGSLSLIRQCPGVSLFLFFSSCSILSPSSFLPCSTLISLGLSFLPHSCPLLSDGFSVGGSISLTLQSWAVASDKWHAGPTSVRGGMIIFKTEERLRMDCATNGCLDSYWVREKWGRCVSLQHGWQLNGCLPEARNNVCVTMMGGCFHRLCAEFALSYY